MPRSDFEHADVTEYELDPSTGEMVEIRKAEESSLTLDPFTGLMFTELLADTVNTNKSRNYGSGQNFSIDKSGQSGQGYGAFNREDLSRVKKTTQPGNREDSKSAHNQRHYGAVQKEVERLNGYQQKEGKDAIHKSVRQTGLRVVGAIIDDLIARTEAIGEASYHRRRRLSMLSGR